METLTKKQIKKSFLLMKSFVSYVQGQEPEPKVREYFYYIDHQGMVRIFTQLLKKIKLLC